MNQLLNLFKRYSLLIILIFLISCAKHFVPTPQMVNPEKITEFTIDSNINIVNFQKKNTEEFTIGLGMRSYKGNLHEWTSAAVRQLSKELIKRGGTISETGSKVLKLSILKYQIKSMMRTCYSLTLHLEMNNGYKKDYNSTNCIAPFGNSIARGFGGAITLAITKILNDEKVLNYLKE